MQVNMIWPQNLFGDLELHKNSHSHQAPSPSPSPNTHVVTNTVKDVVHTSDLTVLCLAS